MGSEMCIRDRCEVDMFISFLQNDNSTINVTIPVGHQAYQNCIVLKNSVAFYYKTTIYSINEQRYRVQISEDSWEEAIVYSPIKLTTIKTKVKHTGMLIKVSITRVAMSKAVLTK